MKITTKTGDRGETSLFRGRRVSKDSVFIELVGQLDELQSYVGWAKCGVKDVAAAGNVGSAGVGSADLASGDLDSAGVASADEASAAAILNRVQDDLYRMMAVVGYEMKCPDNVMAISEGDVEFLEKYVVEAQDLVKDLKEFVRPGSTEAAARLHICRTVCRRVERRMVAAVGTEGVGVEEVAVAMLRYLNRLSDLLFVLGYKFEKK